MRVGVAEVMSGLTLDNESASDCVADASSMVKLRNENDLLNAADCVGLGRPIWFRRRVVKD